ncbi:phospholipase-like protein [Tanacetum coccineum]
MDDWTENCILLHFMLGQQLVLTGNENENIPLYYHIVDNFHIQFGREEFCLVSGLKFGVENSTDYNKAKDPIPFRRRVFSSDLDGRPIRGKDVELLIVSDVFKKLDDNDVVSLCCVGILQLVLLGVEDRRVVPNWILRLANDRVSWDNYPWGSYVWPTLYKHLRDANVKRWQPLYASDPTNETDTKSYSIEGFAWAFKVLIRERTENANWTLAKSGTVCLHQENNRFMILTDPHNIGTLDGSVRPFPSWNDVTWVYMPINVGGVHWVTGAIDLADSIFYVFDSMESETRMLILAEMMKHVITNYTSDSEENKREVTQNDYTLNQMVEWAEQEHFEDEETKLSCPKINLSTVLKSNKGSSDKSFQSLSYLHEMQKRKQKFEETKAVQHQDIKKHINPENVRLSVLAKLQEALDEEDILADQILTMMHRYADRFTNRRVEINNLMVLQDHPLVDYGKYAFGCMTGADMKKCVHLKSVRGELLRSMEEKRELMENYRDM